MIMLTSYDRMLRYLGQADGTLLTDEFGTKRDIMNWIASVSKMVDNFLGYEIELKSRTEYFDIKYGQDEFFVGGMEVKTLTDVYEDTQGAFNGNESEIGDCWIGSASRSVCLPFKLLYAANKGLRIRYTGGLAYYGTKTEFTIAVSAGDFDIGRFVKGISSEAVGIVKAMSGTTLTLEVLFGVFVVGETITEYTTEACTTAEDGVGTITTIDKQSLIEQYPDIVRAAEIQVRHFWKHKEDFELTNTSKDGTSVRRGNESTSYLLPEAENLLRAYRRIV